MSFLTVRADQCVHQRVVGAECANCIQSCPQKAWQIHEDGLGFDEDLCDGCGLCVAACPMEALTIDVEVAHTVASRSSKNDGRFACHRISISEEMAADVTQLPCLYAVSPGWLWQYSHEHLLIYLEIAVGDCAQCERGLAGQEWRRQWTQIAKITSMVGSLPQLKLVSPSAWTSAPCNKDPAIPARRAFFRKISMPSSSQQATNTQKYSNTISSARAWLINQLRTQVPTSTTVPLQPLWAVAWNPAQCTGCLSCTRICPTQALRVEIAHGESAATSFVADMSRCIDCGLCIALCQTNALGKTNWASSRPENINWAPQRSILNQQCCEACGAMFHRLAIHSSTATANGLCHTCACGRPRQHNRLVQPIAKAPTQYD